MGVQPPVAAHDDREKMQPLPFRRRDQAIACRAGITGFDTGRARVQVAVSAVYRLRADEGVRVVVFALFMHVGRGDGHVGDVAHDHEIVVRDRLLRDQEHLVGRCLVVVGKAVRVLKMGDLASELRGALVHLVHEAVDAAADQRGDHVAGVAGGLDHRAVEQVAEGHLLPGLDLGAAALFIQTGAAVRPGGNHLVQAVLSPVDRLHRQQHRHDLGQTGGRHDGILVLGIDDPACVEVGEDDVLAVQLRRGGCIRRRRRRAYEQRSKQNQGQKEVFFHFTLPFPFGMWYSNDNRPLEKSGGQSENRYRFLSDRTCSARSSQGESLAPLPRNCSSLQSGAPNQSLPCAPREAVCPS